VLSGLPILSLPQTENPDRITDGMEVNNITKKSSDHVQYMVMIFAHMFSTFRILLSNSVIEKYSPVELNVIQLYSIVSFVQNLR